MLRVPMIILAVLYLAFSVFTAGVGAFADGGTIPERILISLIHPQPPPAPHGGLLFGLFGNGWGVGDPQEVTRGSFIIGFQQTTSEAGGPPGGG